MCSGLQTGADARRGEECITAAAAPRAEAGTLVTCGCMLQAGKQSVVCAYSLSFVPQHNQGQPTKHTGGLAAGAASEPRQLLAPLTR
jgi:hypothetical protein